MTLPHQLRHLRDRLGLTQKELADAADVSQALISQYESGRKTPSVATLSRLTTVLGPIIIGGDLLFTPDAPVELPGTTVERRALEWVESEASNPANRRTGLGYMVSNLCIVLMLILRRIEK